ncbi:MAG: hypothetical protein M1G31_28820 [Pseudanabaena sp. Salubria-1]|jgi:hypothetical protein|nr:hypothetical protein [Pseudanabaena sp. Salubria-1]
MFQSNQPPFNDLASLKPAIDTLESEQNSEDSQAITPTDSQAIQPKRNSVVKSEDGINQTRSKLANGLLRLSIGISVGIAVLVTVDLGISKFIAWRLIEKLSEAPVSSPQTGTSATASPAPSSPTSPDKSGDATQKLIVYKDLLKEASLNKELLTLLLTSQTALVSGALGFYFGGKDNN